MVNRKYNRRRAVNIAVTMGLALNVLRVQPPVRILRPMTVSEICRAKWPCKATVVISR